MVKLLMSWDIRPGQERTYFNFVMREFAPGLGKLGLQLTEAWYTLYGEGPQILTAGVTDDMEEMTTLLESDEFEELLEQLREYVINLQYRVVAASGRFQF
jgi:hypothetical protein